MIDFRENARKQLQRAKDELASAQGKSSHPDHNTYDLQPSGFDSKPGAHALRPGRRRCGERYAPRQR